MKRKLQLIIFMLILFSEIGHVHAQNLFQLNLLDQRDSLPISFAKVEDSKSHKTYRSDINGVVQLQFKKIPSYLNLEIKFIGYQGLISFSTAGIQEKTIYLEKQSFQLQEAKIKGLSAKEIMLRVVENIPNNYMDSSFLLLGNYRQYHQINGKYKNLIEAQMGIAHQIQHQQNEIKSKESFAIIQLRRSHYYYPIDDYVSDDIQDLMYENPVYYLMRKSLNPRAFDEYEFRFDTSSFISKKTYLIHYKNKSLPAERHSIDGYENGFFSGEAFEEGYFVVDKDSYALLEMERSSVRNPNYHYPQSNNYVMPNKKYTIEFGGAHLKLKFESKNNKYYLKEIYHQFTHDFFDATMGIKRYQIAEFFEWNSILATRVLPKELDLINRIEDVLTDEKSFYNWLPAYVGYQQLMPEYRDCVDFKFKKTDIEHDPSEASKKLQKIWQDCFDRKKAVVDDYTRN
ncbi:MAG: hypothetical protein ACOVP1_09405, partial [Bacteroidia bacterium]